MADIKVGLSDWAVIISTSFTGAVGSETPDGDLYYFNCKDVKYNGVSLDKGIPAAGFVIRYPTGKKEISVKISDCTVPAAELATSTQELNRIENFMYTSSIKVGATKVFLFLFHIDGHYKKMNWDSDHNHIQYLEGYFANWNSTLTDDEYIWKLDFMFKEATLP